MNILNSFVYSSDVLISVNLKHNSTFELDEYIEFINNAEFNEYIFIINKEEFTIDAYKEFLVSIGINSDKIISSDVIYYDEDFLDPIIETYGNSDDIIDIFTYMYENDIEELDDIYNYICRDDCELNTDLIQILDNVEVDNDIYSKFNDMNDIYILGEEEYMTKLLFMLTVSKNKYLRFHKFIY